jgi:hypothetical protein
MFNEYLYVLNKHAMKWQNMNNPQRQLGVADH